MKPAPEFPLDVAHPGSQPNPSEVKQESIPQDIKDAIRSDYRSGLTYSKLSEKFGLPIPALVALRKAGNWRKDLREDVKAETFARLSADSVSLGSCSDEEVVQGAAKQGAAVVQRHRLVLRDHIEACTLLAAQLRIAAQGKDPDVAFLGPKETLADAALKLGNALARAVPLERIAYGLNDRQDEKPYEERLREFYAAQQAKRRELAAKRSAEGA